MSDEMCEHDARPSSVGSFAVLSRESVAEGVHRLVLSRGASDSLSSLDAPAPGQFYLLRARPSAVLLGRPISVYTFDETSISFLILERGEGSRELCSALPGTLVDLLGPIGNRFLTPRELVCSELVRGDLDPASLRVACLGGGIGVAPVAGFALSLDPRSFDFYASFRSTPYGLEGIAERANRLVVTTEDGSAGTKGMLPAVFDASKYDVVYACGPTPMLKYVKEATATVPYSFLSLEQHMACGAGACLGCTVRTTHGNRRCCVDGPVFDAKEVLL